MGSRQENGVENGVNSIFLKTINEKINYLINSYFIQPWDWEPGINCDKIEIES